MYPKERSPPRQDGQDSLVLIILKLVQDLCARVKRSRHWVLGPETLRLAPLSLSVRQHVLAAPPPVVKIVYESLHTQGDRTPHRGLARLSGGADSLRSTNALFSPSWRS